MIAAVSAMSMCFAGQALADVGATGSGAGYKWEETADSVVWTISGNEGWSALVEAFKKDGDTPNRYEFSSADYKPAKVLLGADIEVTESLGTEDVPFSGSFSGQGHTLTCKDVEGAPFGYVSASNKTPNTGESFAVHGTTIEDLIVTGTIGSDQSGRAGGLVLCLGGVNESEGGYGIVVIRRCKMGADIKVSGSDYQNGVKIGAIAQSALGPHLAVTNCETCGKVDLNNNAGYVCEVTTEAGQGETSTTTSAGNIDFSRCLFKTDIQNSGADTKFAISAANSFPSYDEHNADKLYYSYAGLSYSEGEGPTFKGNVPQDIASLEVVESFVLDDFTREIIGYDDGDGNPIEGERRIYQNEEAVYWQMEEGMPTLGTDKEKRIYWIYEGMETEAPAYYGDNIIETFGDYLDDEMLVIVDGRGRLTDDMTVTGNTYLRSVESVEYDAENDAYEIEGISGWNEFAELWNEGSLGESANLKVLYEIYFESDEVEPKTLGTKEHPFSGSIYGGSWDSRIFCSRILENGGTAGLLGYVKDVEISQISFDVSLWAEDEKTNVDAVALIGHAEGTNKISQCKVMVSVEGGAGTRCGLIGETAEGSVTEISDFAFNMADGNYNDTEHIDERTLYVFCGKNDGKIKLTNGIVGLVGGEASTAGDHFAEEGKNIETTNVYTAYKNGVGIYSVTEETGYEDDEEVTWMVPNATLTSGEAAYTMQGEREELVWGQWIEPWGGRGTPELLVFMEDASEEEYRVSKVTYKYADKDTAKYTTVNSWDGYFSYEYDKDGNEIKRVLPDMVKTFGLNAADTTSMLTRVIVGEESYSPYRLADGYSVSIKDEPTIVIKTYKAALKEEGKESEVDEEGRLHTRYTGREKAIGVVFTDENGEVADDLNPMVPNVAPDGPQQEPERWDYIVETFMWDEWAESWGNDYGLIYPGEYLVKVTGEKSSLTGIDSLYFVVDSGRYVVDAIEAMTYDQDTHDVDIVVRDADGEKLTIDDDYALYEKTGEGLKRIWTPKIKDAGVKTFVVSRDKMGCGSDTIAAFPYYEEKAVEVKVEMEPGTFTAKLDATELRCTGEPIAPTLTVVDDAFVMNRMYVNSEYFLYEDGERVEEITKQTEPGEYSVRVVGSDNYSTDVTLRWVIVGEELKAKIENAELAYNGKAQTPELTVFSGETTLEQGKDYELRDATGEEIEAIEGQTKPGKYAFTVVGKGLYAGSDTTIEWSIVRGTFIAKLKESSLSYTRKEIVPEVIVVNAANVNDTLTVGEDYMIVCGGEKGVSVVPETEPGKYTLTVTGDLGDDLDGCYTGETELTWEIEMPVQEAAIETAADFMTIFESVGEKAEYDYLKDIELAKNVLMELKELILQELTHAKAMEELKPLKTIEELKANFNGNRNTIENLTAVSTGLFGTVKEGVKVSDLMIKNATVYIDPTDKRWRREGNKIIAHLIADTNEGEIDNLAFVGQVIVDETKLKAGEEVVVSLVGENKEGALLRALNYDTSILEGESSNKRCITIKQNIGCAKNSGRAKVASSKASNNKALDTKYEYSEEEVNKMERTFTAAEFASGVVAYWLNWSEQGYTGEYKPIWRQGEKYPELAIDIDGVMNALYKVNYVINDDKNIVDAPIFANNGDKITVTYSEKPEMVMNGEDKVEIGETSFTVVFDATKALTIKFKEANALMTADREVIEAVGRTIVAPAGSEVYSLGGVLQGKVGANGLTVRVPGMYLVVVKGESFKILVK